MARVEVSVSRGVGLGDLQSSPSVHPGLPLVDHSESPGALDHGASRFRYKCKAQCRPPCRTRAGARGRRHGAGTCSCNSTRISTSSTASLLSAERRAWDPGRRRAGRRRCRTWRGGGLRPSMSLSCLRSGGGPGYRVAAEQESPHGGFVLPRVVQSARLSRWSQDARVARVAVEPRGGSWRVSSRRSPTLCGPCR
jgi:hypothetical protein